MTTKTCSTCGDKIVGRSDRTFCSKKCQNKHHAIARIICMDTDDPNNKRINRNFVILNGIFQQRKGKLRVHRDQLFKVGFDITAYEKLSWKNNGQFLQIQDYFFRLIENGHVEVIRTKSQRQFYFEFTLRWDRLFNVEIIEWDYVDRRGLRHFFHFIEIVSCFSLVTNVLWYKNFRGNRMKIKPSTQ